MTFPIGARLLTIPGQGAVAAERPFPSLGAQIVNAGVAIARNGLHLSKTGNLRVSPEVASARFAICQACPLFEPQTERCSHPRCGCFTRLKTRLTAERCPDSPPKW